MKHTVMGFIQEYATALELDIKHLMLLSYIRDYHDKDSMKIIGDKEYKLIHSETILKELPILGFVSRHQLEHKLNRLIGKQLIGQTHLKEVTPDDDIRWVRYFRVTPNAYTLMGYGEMTDEFQYLLDMAEEKRNRTYRPFVKPTLKEVKAYCRKRRNKISPEYFFDYYESNGWTLNGKPMKNWKCEMVVWERKQKAQAKEDRRRQKEAENIIIKITDKLKENLIQYAV